MQPSASQDALPHRAASVVSLVAALIEEGHREHASDVHLDPTPLGIRVRIRIDGILFERHILPSSIHSELIARIKILAGLRTDEHNASQDGRFRHAFGEPPASVDVRVSIMPTYHGENVVLRLLYGAVEEYSLLELGFGEEERLKIESVLTQSNGMILATGPTGSGKTTTLYTLLRKLSVPRVSIVTIEDPIEYAIEGIRQIQVNTRTGLLFATGLRSLLRQDPDIIMVGEIRDEDTARVAVNTALTGHLLLSTLHTTDAPTAIPRLLDIGIEPYLLASTLSLIIGQRLVRKICTECRTEITLPKDVASRLAAFTKENPVWFTGTGCTLCKESGYRGRVSINEVMVVTDALREAIMRGGSAHEFKTLAKKAGMKTMIEDGLEKAQRGETSVEEVLRAIHE
ncbi:MAG: GspE/PulE family protein [Minisyncoccia bacterium]